VSTTNSTRQPKPAGLTRHQIALATRIVRNEIAKQGSHIRIAVAQLHPGVVHQSNTGHTCNSGTLLRVTMIGSFPHGKVAPTPGGDGTVRAEVVEANPSTGQECLIGVKTGRVQPPKGATRLVSMGQHAASRARAITASAVQTTITLNDYGATFAPPPANASPPLTVQQAWAQFIQSSTVGSGGTAIPSGTTAQLGLFTFAVGPSSGCGTTNCNKLIVQNGTAYSALNQLAYGYSYQSTCVSGNDIHPLPPSPCTQWWFIDANTGHMIVGMEQFRAAS